MKGTHSSTLIPFISPSNYLNCPRGKGPLKNSSDVINAAKKIAEAGSRMDKLARAVADQVALKVFIVTLSPNVKSTLTLSLLVPAVSILI